MRSKSAWTHTDFKELWVLPPWKRKVLLCGHTVFNHHYCTCRWHTWALIMLEASLDLLLVSPRGKTCGVQYKAMKPPLSGHSIGQPPRVTVATPHKDIHMEKSEAVTQSCNRPKILEFKCFTDRLHWIKGLSNRINPLIHGWHLKLTQFYNANYRQIMIYFII